MSRSRSARTTTALRDELVRAAAGAGLAVLLQGGALRWPPGGAARWTRTNHRGRRVSLLAGPVLAIAATAAVPLPMRAAAVAGLGAGAVGLYDDTVGSRVAQQSAKGFRGHLAALRRGQVTSGLVKVAAIGAAGLVAAALLPREERSTRVDLLLGGAVVAGGANLLNLFDLRPGRALKTGVLVAALTRQPGAGAVAAALLPADLRERTMLGDAGANALGALLGLGLLRRTPDRAGRARLLAGVAGLTAASEVVSFTRVIEAVPPLRVLDRLGRLP